MDNFEAFNGKATFPAYTVAELEAFILAGRDGDGKMTAEVARRAKVAAGDMTLATGGERIRYAKTGQAR